MKIKKIDINAMKTIGVLIILIIMFPVSMARDYIGIEGWVVDERTGEPLGLCYVYIEGTDYVAMTDEDGTFIVRIPSIYHKDMLVAYQEGY